VQNGTGSGQTITPLGQTLSCRADCLTAELWSSQMPPKTTDKERQPLFTSHNTHPQQTSPYSPSSRLGPRRSATWVPL